jgi:hypothetical protein
MSFCICHLTGVTVMLKRLKAIWSTPDLRTFDGALTRERLIQNSRIVFIDDEHPLLIDELKQAHFAVDHDADGSDLTRYDSQVYDVAILDYHGVGQRLGAGQGLDLLKYIRRVSPSTRVIAYTSRSLSAAESEFFRLSHAVLPKDMGLGDSLAVIETELTKALSKDNLFEALMQKLNVTSPGEKMRLRKALAKSLAGNNDRKIKDTIIVISGAVALKAAEMIIAKILGGH